MLVPMPVRGAYSRQGVGHTWWWKVPGRGYDDGSGVGETVVVMGPTEIGPT